MYQYVCKRIFNIRSKIRWLCLPLSKTRHTHQWMNRVPLYILLAAGVQMHCDAKQEDLQEGHELSELFFQELSEYSDMRIFSGSGNVELAKELCVHLRTQLGRAQIDRYADGEIKIKVLDEVRGADVYVVQSSPSPTDSHTTLHDAFMELVFMVSALRRSSAKRIVAIVPYMGYARQTQLFNPAKPKPIAASDVALMLSVVGVDAVMFLDVHNPRMEGMFPEQTPCINIDSQALAVQYFKKKDFEKPVVVATDQTGGERTMAFWERLKHAGINAGYVSMVSNRRKRSSHDGPLIITHTKDEDPDATYTTPSGHKKIKSLITRDWLVGDVKDSDCIIVDDIIDSGVRAERTAQQLKRAGARKIYMFSTHGLFSKGAMDRIIKSPINEVIITNSVQLPANLYCEKLVVLSVGGLIAETIRRIHHNDSVSTLFKHPKLENIQVRGRELQNDN